MIVELRDEGGSPYTEEIVLRGHDVTEDAAREAVTGWLLDEGVCDDEAEAEAWWQGLAWPDRRYTFARKIPDPAYGGWRLSCPHDRGPGAFPVTILRHRVDIARERSDAARRQRIEDAARAVWPDCDPYLISGYRGGYLHADVGEVRVRVSWQGHGAQAAPSLYLPRAVGADVMRRLSADVAEIHRLLTEGDR